MRFRTRWKEAIRTACPGRAVFFVLVFFSAHIGGGKPAESAPSLPPSGRYSIVPEKSRVSAYVRSTLHNFDVVPERFKGELTLDASGARIHFEFPTAELVTGNILRDAVLRGQTLQAEKHPRAVFDSRSVVLLGRSGDGQRYRVSGLFSIHGVKREIAFPVSVKLSGDAVVAEARFPLRLSDHKIFPPALPFIRVEDQVEVRARFVLRPENELRSGRRRR